jgi:hypothetical protein
MSIEYIRRVFRFSQAEHAARLVLLAIADNASEDDGSAYPSVNTLARKSKLSERATQGATKKLVEIGELKIEVGAGRNGSNLYTILIGENGEESAPVQNLQGAQKTDGTGANSAPKPSGRTVKTTLTDAQWIDSLIASPAYTGIDVRRELAKCENWCNTNRKQFSRRRFVNWLNRCEAPLAVTSAQLPAGIVRGQRPPPVAPGGGWDKSKFQKRIGG